MITATALTLLVVPVFYSLFDDARAALLALLRRALTLTPHRTPGAGAWFSRQRNK